MSFPGQRARVSAPCELYPLCRHRFKIVVEPGPEGMQAACAARDAELERMLLAHLACAHDIIAESIEAFRRDYTAVKPLSDQYAAPSVLDDVVFEPFDLATPVTFSMLNAKAAVIQPGQVWLDTSDAATKWWRAWDGNEWVQCRDEAHAAEVSAAVRARQRP